MCVPGTVKAFFELHRRHGRKAAADLLREVARRAEAGVPVTQYEADCLNRLAPRLAVSPEARRIYVRDRPYQAGDPLVNPSLARTLEELAREGEGAFYRGRIAELLVADLAANGGFVTAADLAAYQVREVQPLALEIQGRQVWTVPPEAGGAMLLEILAILDQPEVRRLAWGGPDYHHRLAQACKMAFIDRMDYLGDVPLGDNTTYRGLLGRDRADRWFACIDPARDTATGDLAARMRTGRPGPRRHESGHDTTHFAVIDAEGNAVSNSYTMNLRYGSKWAVAGAGFLLNGSIDSFSFVEGKENYYGVVGSAPNLFAPGKRPASNMAPVLVTGPRGCGSGPGHPGRAHHPPPPWPTSCCPPWRSARTRRRWWPPAGCTTRAGRTSCPMNRGSTGRTCSRPWRPWATRSRTSRS